MTRHLSHSQRRVARQRRRLDRNYILMREEASERRWIILLEGRRYATVGRATDLSAEEIRRIEEAMQVQGLV
jgi:hypothetical protein